MKSSRTTDNFARPRLSRIRGTRGAAHDGLAGSVRRGLAWSAVTSLMLRLGSVVLGMVLARLLAPEEFGVYAVALTVQSILMTLADLGMSVDLVRAEDPARRAPTVATLSLLSSCGLALVMMASASPVARLMGAPEAAGVLVVMSLTLVVSGGGVVPYAYLQRDFEQRKLFASSMADFAVGTSVTIALVLLGMGPMALAVGRVAAQLAATALQFVLTRLRPHFAFDRSVARSALACGVPLAAANLVSWALINADNVIIARVVGVASLGLYVLAFNVSNWPMSAIGQAVRAVSLAGFSRASRERRSDRDDGSLETALALTWTVALPVGILLAALAHPLIVLFYGERWAASASVLAALGTFGALRVVLDLLATYLMARGAARAVLYVQIAWFVTLIPAVAAGAHWMGIKGAGWAHLAVGSLVVLPLYAIALNRSGTPPRVLVRALWPPLVAAVPTWWIAHTVAAALEPPVLALLLGGVAGCVTSVALSYWRVRHLLLDRNTRADAPGKPRIEQPALEGVR